MPFCVSESLPACSLVLLGLDRGAGLLGDAGLLAEVDLGLEDLEDFQHDRGGQAGLRLAAGAVAAARRVDQVFGPAVQRVGPEFALGDRQAILLLDVVAELPQAADDVLLSASRPARS